MPVATESASAGVTSGEKAKYNSTELTRPLESMEPVTSVVNWPPAAPTPVVTPLIVSEAYGDGPGVATGD